ncbi:MAG: nucleotidyl transferase AbiEii/AbiGii toxin family protein [Acidimicrobiia bacterium]|nr:nucleotidyl transferase AbiEii/AbiGii toxin family protein [Acidimicrobiia bacterium]
MPNEWRVDAIPSAAEELLEHWQASSLLEGFYLAGGTALALQLGHRRSVDLDFFSGRGFDVEAHLQKLHRLGGFSLTGMAVGTVHGHCRGVKVSFLEYDYPVLFPFLQYQQVSVAHPLDIGCMKLSAIAARGARRDFIDVHAVCFPSRLGEVVQLFQKKYAGVNFSLLHLLKSLTWFEDAEKEPMPDMLTSTSWAEVKDFFLREAPALL